MTKCIFALRKNEVTILWILFWSWILIFGILVFRKKKKNGSKSRIVSKINLLIIILLTLVRTEVS